MKARTTLLLALSLFAGAGAAAAPGSGGAVFCHRHKGHAVDAFAGRIVAGNRLQFRIDRWDSAGQTYSTHGTAEPKAGHWVYRSDDRSCRLTIRWLGRRGASGFVDPAAPCDDDAAPAFNGGDRSFAFGAADYRRGVRRELDPDSDGFTAELPC